MVVELRAVVRWMVGEVSDLLTRQDTALQLAVAAREHATFKVPVWFWVAESENARGMLTRRAKYLRGAKVDVDQAWNLLTEFLESIHQPADQGLLSDIVTATYGKGN